MKYYIAIHEHLFTTAILTNSGEFVELDGQSPTSREDLRTFPSFFSAKEEIKGKHMEYKGEKVEVFPSGNTFFETHIAINSFRTTKPSHSFFTKKEVQNAIANGEDCYHNRLAIDHNGKVQLVHRNVAEYGFPVLNGETFVAGEGLVGKSAAEDEFLIEKEYKRLLFAWALHLHSDGSMIPAIGDYPELDIEKITNHITTLLKEKYTTSTEQEV